MKSNKRLGILEIFRKTFSIAERLTGKKYLIHLALSIVGSFLEIAGLAVIVPVIGLIFNPDVINQNKYVSALFVYSNASGMKEFASYLLIGIAVFFILKNIFHAIINYYQYNFFFNLSTLLSQRTLQAFLKNSYAYFTNANTGHLIHKVLSVPIEFGANMILSVFTFIGEFLVLTLIVIFLAVMNIKIFLLVSLTILPITVLFYAYIKKRMNKINEELKYLHPESNKHLLPALQNYIDIKIMRKEDFFIKNVIYYLSKINRNYVLNYTLQYIPYRVIELTILIGIFGIFLFTIITTSSFQTLGTIIGVYSLSAFRILPSLNRIITSVVKIHACEYVLDSINESLAVEEENSQTTQKVSHQKISFKKSIVLKNLSFKYTEVSKNAIDNISLEISNGECIGIVGLSGSGKTTLLRIILRLLHEQKGNIFVDGVLIDESHLYAWWKLIGYVQQDVYIIDGTLKENIAFGMYENEINIDHLRQAIQLSGLADFVNSLPDGLNSNLGEFGAKISGGQRQRIGIARALYKDSEIFLFDEITSSLDNETEKAILESIASLKDKGKTIIIISHRHSTLQYCDRIFNLEKGKISLNSK